MYISPCGWFCFEVPDEWRSMEKKDGVLLVTLDNTAVAEIHSARKSTPMQVGELSEIHESYLRSERLKPDETRFFETQQNLECILSACTNGNHLIIIAHIGWTHYAVFLHLELPLDEDIEERLSDLQFILDSIESLTVD